jgi:LysR family nitrogen assimilation transcriptional regulator
MNIKQLRYFVKVAECGGFSQAADAVQLAQSALSRHIRLLEEELNTRLFNRTGRGATLTEQGEYLLTHSKSILEQLLNVERSLQSWYEHPSGLVRLGMTPTAIINGTAALIRDMNKRYPEVKLNVSEGISDLLCNRVIDNQLDLAIVFEEPESDLLRIEVLRREELCLIAAPDLKLPAPSVPIAMLNQLRLILPAQYGKIRRAVERSFVTAGISCNPTYEVDAVPAIKSLVMQGEGVAVLPRHAVEGEEKLGLLSAHSLDDPSLYIPLCVIYRAKQQVTRATVATLDSVRSVFAA